MRGLPQADLGAAPCTLPGPSVPRACPAPPNLLQVREAEHNIRAFRRLWAKAARLAAAGLDGFAATHDGMGALEFLAADEEAAEAAAAAAANATAQG